MATINPDTPLDPIEVLNGPFDPKMHAKVFVNYLEVVIDSTGTVAYATPSHLQKLLALAYDAYVSPTIQRPDDIWNLIPKTEDPVEWLCERLSCICVWNDRYQGIANAAQADALWDLAQEGLYKGPVPIVADITYVICDPSLGDYELEVETESIDVTPVLDTLDVDEVAALADDPNPVVDILDDMHLLRRPHALWPGVIDCTLGGTFDAYLHVRRQVPESASGLLAAREQLLMLKRDRLYDARRTIEDELHQIYAEVSDIEGRVGRHGA